MRLLRALVPLLVAGFVAAGCSGARGNANPAVAQQGIGSVTASPSPVAPAPLAGKAPTKSYPVGVRMLKLSNGPDRPLPTTLYYPVTRPGGSTTAAGRFPVVLFSHGLTGHPTNYHALLTRWAAAGLVVVAPAYPHTSRGVPTFDILDVVNQPVDASYALTTVLALDGTAGDALRGHLDTAHIGAAGHSAGGITTVGLFTARRDARLSAGIVLAGSALGVGDVYSGPPASLLFVHGRQDSLVSYASGKAAYDRAPWAKALFTLPTEGHADPYLAGAGAAFTAVSSATADFLRWTLYGDPAARKRLATDIGRTGTLDDHL